jgi:hypothetical protein
MLVFFDQRLVFLATPKTGSTAIESALQPLAALTIERPPVLKHTNAQRFHRFIGPYLEAASGAEFTVTAMMREPVSWLGSWYRYRKRGDGVEARNRTNDVTFDDFVQAWCREDPPPFADVGRQSRFLKGHKDKSIDRLFRYERIEDFVDFLEDQLDCAITLPRLNVSPEGDLTLSDRTRALLEREAAADFALYASIPGG